MMTPLIHLKKKLVDDDIFELQISVSDGNSIFVSTAYEADISLNEKIKELEEFQPKVYGGIYDLKFGEFGPEFANGAFRARLHTRSHQSTCISTTQQSGYFDFSNYIVASEARFYLRTELALLDKFVLRLKAMNAGDVEDATLECFAP